MSKLGRRQPSDWNHVERYPYSALPLVPVFTPVVLGINWYTNFDNPVQVDNTYWIGRGDLGSIRGGHAICAEPVGAKDSNGRWRFYDQGSEGACVGFSTARQLSLLRGGRYDGRDIYAEAQRTDEYPDTPPAEGTSVRAGLEVLRTRGARRYKVLGEGPPLPKNGIKEYRWATTWDEVRLALGIPPNAPGIPLLNSWGTSYPHRVRLTDEAGERLLNEDGEAAIITGEGGIPRR